MMEQKTIDYKKELENLRRNDVPFWKPKQGQHHVIFLSEMRERQYVDKSTGEVVPQAEVLIETNKEQYLWAFTKGQTRGSLYGQLLEVASSKGKLCGEVVLVNVKVSGTTQQGHPKRDYFVFTPQLGEGGLVEEAYL